MFRDWNGSKRGHVYKFLRSQGFVSSYDTAHHYTDSDADCHKVIFKFLDMHRASLMLRALISYAILHFPLFFLLQWVSHRNHRGNICGVDFIWLLNPNMYRKPLRTSWSEAVFGIIKVKTMFEIFIHHLCLFLFPETLEVHFSIIHTKIFQLTNKS